MSTGKLFIVATPIGNLEDITYRAIDTLKSVNFVACEDTRVTKKLLNFYKIKTKTIIYHQHSSETKMLEIKKILEDAKDVALVTDAGTPGISDPGNKLIKLIISSQAQIEIIPIPGASAALAALSVSGFSTDKFIFLGFPPHKKRRKHFFQEVSKNKYTVVFYESPHRIKKTLQNLAEVLNKNRQICICRELTKKFESIYRGSIEEILEMKIKEKGEFTLVVRAMSSKL